MENNYKKIFYVLAALEIIVLSLIFVGGFGFLSGQIKAASAEFQEKKNLFDSLQKKSVYSAEAMNDYKDIKKNKLDSLYGRLLDIKEPPVGFMVSVENLVKKWNLSHQISVAAAASEEQRIGGALPFFSFGINLNGNYVNTIRFLKSLENLGYFLEVDNASIGAATDGSDNVQMNLTIKVYAY